MGAWQTFWVGIAVVVAGFPITWVLGDAKEPFLKWLGEAFKTLWGAVTWPVPVPLFLVVAFFVVLVALGLANRMLKASKRLDSQKNFVAKQRTMVNPSTATPEGSISAEEDKVLRALVPFLPRGSYDDVYEKTGLSKLRFAHALEKLADDRKLVTHRDGHMYLTKDGRAFVVKHNLDQSDK